MIRQFAPTDIAGPSVHIRYVEVSGTGDVIDQSLAGLWTNASSGNCEVREHCR